MNLTDLQMELRTIEEHISALHHQIEKMKPQTAGQQKTDFEKITKLAAQHPLVNTRIKEAPKEVQKLIMGSFVFLVLAEKTDIYSRLLYLCRLSKGSGCDLSAEELYQLGLAFERSDLDKLGKDLADYKYTYLVEALIVANLSGEASAETLSSIADLANLMKCGKEEMCVLGMMAKSILLGNPDYMLEMPVPFKNRWSGKLKEFISSGWVEKHRELCGLLCMTEYRNPGFFTVMNMWTNSKKEDYFEFHICEMKKRPPDGSIVKRGDVICTYTEKGRNITDGLFGPSYETEAVEKTVKAPCDGVVYFVETQRSSEVEGKNDEYMAIYVISYFDDHSEFSNWYKITGRVSVFEHRQAEEEQQ